MDIIEAIIKFLEGIHFVFIILFIVIAVGTIVWYFMTTAIEVPDDFDEGDVLGIRNEPDDTYQPQPYQVVVNNPTDKELNCVLFGYAKYIHSENYGSDKGLIVEPSASYISYLELLCQSAFKPFKASYTRILSKNLSQVVKAFTITSKDATGQMAQIPVIVKSYQDDTAIQKEIVDVKYPISIGFNTHLEFPVEPNTKVVMTFYPERERFGERIKAKRI